MLDSRNYHRQILNSDYTRQNPEAIHVSGFFIKAKFFIFAE